jgi:hypothetical protein
MTLHILDKVLYGWSNYLERKGRLIAVSRTNWILSSKNAFYFEHPLHVLALLSGQTHMAVKILRQYALAAT